MKKYVRVVVSTIGLMVAMVLPVFAQTTATVGPGNGFRVSPVREELTIQPGNSQVVEIAVENITNENITAHPVVNDFVASDGEDGQPRLLLDDSQTGGNSFKNLIGKLPDIPLTPHERKVFKVAINVPANASGGGYYGAIRFSPASDTSDQQVSLTASVGVLYLVKVPGQIIEKLDLLTLSAAHGKKTGTIFGSSPDNVVVRLKNPGTIHMQPFGRVRVKDMRGRVISDQEFNNTDPRGNVLPNSIRHFDTPITGKAKFGKYSIEINLGYGTGGGDLITAVATFWVIPMWFVILLAVLAALIAGGVLYWKNQRRKQKRYR